MLRRFLAVVVLLAACSPPPAGTELQGVALETPLPRAEFVLHTTEGEPFDFAAETAGELTLLYFGYTYCPDICPVHLSQIAETLRVHPHLASTTTVVFVTVDPERDTPERIRTFLDNFDTRFIGLTGSMEELEAAQRAAGVPVAVKEGDGDDYTVGHAGQVLAWAPDDLMRTQYPFGTRQGVWTNDLLVLSEVAAS